MAFVGWYSDKGSLAVSFCVTWLSESPDDAAAISYQQDIDRQELPYRMPRVCPLFPRAE